MITIKRALISVSDKEGIVDFAQFLYQQGVEIIATGNTLKLLKNKSSIASSSIKSVSEFTGFPEILDGRVKTLHPKVHAALLAVLSKEEHLAEMKREALESIDLLVVNLYPFKETIQKENVNLDEAIEQIDIGGPAMLRAASKNYKHTIAVCDISHYSTIKDAMLSNKNKIEESLSFKLARLSFQHVSSYDNMIVDYLFKQDINSKSNLSSKNNEEKASDSVSPEQINIAYQKNKNIELRYGENPHQKATFYTPISSSTLLFWEQMQGKQLSYNNILDANAALGIILDLLHPGVAIIKHLNPCGIAIDQLKDKEETELLSAFQLAWTCDPISAFGSIIALNGVVREKLALEISKNFVEIVLAMDFTKEALEIFSKKKNLRILKVNKERLLEAHKKFEWELRCVLGGLLYQQRDKEPMDTSTWKQVTERKADAKEWEALLLAWSVIKHIKSNAILFCSSNASLGIGAGQMSRVDSVNIAISKAKSANLSLKQSVVASDAFFPFRDGVDLLAHAGAKAIIQPGGSVRDDEVIRAANEHDIAMIFTQKRHFLH